LTGDLDLWLWKSIGFQILLRTKYVPSLVKIHWRMLILECSQGCYAVKFWPGYLDLWPMRLWPWKSIGFQIILRTRYVPSFVKNPLKDVDSRVFTRMLRGKIFSLWPWSLTYNLENQYESRIINVWYGVSLSLIPNLSLKYPYLV
jgi:hypothetical protein